MHFVKKLFCNLAHIPSYSMHVPVVLGRFGQFVLGFKFFLKDFNDLNKQMVFSCLFGCFWMENNSDIFGYDGSDSWMAYKMPLMSNMYCTSLSFLYNNCLLSLSTLSLPVFYCISL